MRSVGISKWIGWALTVVTSLMLMFSAFMKFSGSPELAEGMTHLGLPMELVATIGVLEVISALLYLIPKTSVLGAILLAGYMGGAVLAHLRVGDPVFTQVGLGVAVWAGIYLREPRLWALLPLRR